MRFETQPFASADVLDVIVRSRRGRVWSSIAAELQGIPRSKVRIEAVRGVRDACKVLAAQGLVVERPRLVFHAV